MIKTKLAYKTVDGKKVYQIPDDLGREMFRLDQEAMKNRYPDFEKGYTATVLTAQGNLYTGVSYMSDTDTLTMHSEMVALAHAAVHGEKEIVAITGPNCHLCKQLIWESSLCSGIDTVIVMEKQGQIIQISISQMMPYPWPEKPRV